MSAAVRVEVSAAGLAVLTVDQPGTKVNVLAPALWDELATALVSLSQRENVSGLIVRGKPGSFIAGADIKSLADADPSQREPTRRLVEQGLAVLATLAELPFPTVAAIEGPCLGGGLEVALACDARVVADLPKTELGLPEVRLGLIPGWGGTQRLARLVGPAIAVDMVCFAETVDARRAVELGLADEIATVDRLLIVAEAVLARFHNDRPHFETIRARKSNGVAVSADSLALIAAAGSRIETRTRGHEPARLAALRVIVDGCNLPLADGLRLETEAFVPLVGSPVSRNLIAVFFLRQRFARETFGLDVSGAAPVQRVGVVGAGVMGAGIAGLLARQGLRVTLTDADAGALQRGVERIRSSLSGDALLRLTPGSFIELVGCDVVIEAVVEDEAVKREVFQRLATVCPDAILATNTSTLSVARLAGGVANPERVAGLHFFNPVDRMALVEVIRGPQTADATLARLVALSRRLGKTPVVVRDAPGFLVNRVLFPYLNEALVLVEEGAKPAKIDAVATRFGMPVGPLRLCDMVGLDVTRSALAVLHSAFPGRFQATRVLDVLLADGRLGQKSGAGFFGWAKGASSADTLLAGDVTHTPEEIERRLFTPMANEARRVLAEGVVGSPAEVDVAMLLGVGFPAFRGGLMRWAESR